MGIRKISNIERIELLEERFGVSLSGIGAEIADLEFCGTGKFEFNVRGEIVALNGGRLERDIKIKMSAFDTSGDCVSVGQLSIEIKKFFGIDVFEFCEFIGSSDVKRVRVFVTSGDDACADDE